MIILHSNRTGTSTYAGVCVFKSLSNRNAKTYSSNLPTVYQNPTQHAVSLFRKWKKIIIQTKLQI